MPTDSTRCAITIDGRYYWIRQPVAPVTGRRVPLILLRTGCKLKKQNSRPSSESVCTAHDTSLGRCVRVGETKKRTMRAKNIFNINGRDAPVDNVSDHTVEEVGGEAKKRENKIAKHR